MRWRPLRRAGGGSDLNNVRFWDRKTDAMKKLLLASVAALLLATGTAHADSDKWESSFRRCTVWKNFTHKDEDARPGRAYESGDEVWTEWPEGEATIALTLEDVLALQNIFHCSKNAMHSGNVSRTVMREK